MEPGQRESTGVPANPDPGPLGGGSNQQKGNLMERSEYLALSQVERAIFDDLLTFVRSGGRPVDREMFWADFIVFLKKNDVPDVAIDDDETLDLDRRLRGNLPGVTRGA